MELQTFVQRSLIIFAILLCYYQSWVGAVDCEQEPYNPACRGSQARKRLTPLPVMRSSNCDDGDCRLPMKFLIAILDVSYASRLMAEIEQNLLESGSQSVLNLLSDYAGLCSVTNLLA
ncbi:PREDICTED: uncharacterized protein LOC105617684 [Atta cephalotes]|uniref:Uncharacterized protein n=1 Tax=Atta cephalotes TaxID=12957 RepID=A0A158NAS5_ATTCE|nr:PREDICTED: uncharacterized protein LOC105617684 [Atta cephalotes]